jgi:CRP-like cAMP-binding protein
MTTSLPDTVNSPLIAELLPAERSDFFRLFKTIKVPAGSYLFHQGDNADGAYLIKHGEVILQMVLPGGHVNDLRQLEAGDFLGEVALYESQKRSLSALAKTDSEVLYVERLDFQAMQFSYHPAAFKTTLALTRMTAQRLADANQATSRLTMAMATGEAPSSHGSTDGGSISEMVPGCSFDYKRFLPSLDFFRRFTPTNLADLVKDAPVFELPRGVRLIEQDQQAENIWIVVRGAVEITRSPRPERLGLLGPGDACGELAFLLDVPSGAACTTAVDTVVMKIDRRLYQSLMVPSSRLGHKFVAALMGSLLKHLTRMNRAQARLEQQMSLKLKDQVLEQGEQGEQA